MKFDNNFLKNLPFIFEKYEIFIILVGVLVAFLFAGFLFYENAYKTVNFIPDVEVELPTVQRELFEKTVKDLDDRRKMAPDLPIIDPFQ